MAWTLFRKNIEWNNDNSQNVMVYKYPFKENGRELNDKSTLTVRESQVAIFVHKGKIADIFEPGLYELGTQIFPILSKLFSWKYAFQTPITVDIYFVNTKQFTDVKWGTQNPIMMRDPEFGNIRVRGYGAFAFKVDDAGTFLKELFGTNSSYTTANIQNYAKTMLISALTDALGESKLSALDLAGNTMELNEIVKAKIEDKFKEIGLKLTNLFIENMSVPQEIEKALDERSKYKILDDTTDTMMKYAAAEAMKTAAGNQGMGGAFMGAGVGLGAGAGMGAMMTEALRATKSQSEKADNAQKPQTSESVKTKTCPSCNAQVDANAKFCPSCGEKMPVSKFCSNCGEKVDANAKFCPSCGNKL